MFQCGGQARTERFKNADVVTIAVHVRHAYKMKMAGRHERIVQLPGNSLEKKTCHQIRSFFIALGPVYVEMGDPR